jgi:hypothetical protein
MTQSVTPTSPPLQISQSGATVVLTWEAVAGSTYTVTRSPVGSTIVTVLSSAVAAGTFTDLSPLIGTEVTYAVTTNPQSVSGTFTYTPSTFPSDNIPITRDADGFYQTIANVNAPIIGSQPGDVPDLTTAMSRASSTGVNQARIRDVDPSNPNFMVDLVTGLKAAVYGPSAIDNNWNLSGSSWGNPSVVLSLNVSGKGMRPVLQNGMGIKGPAGAATATKNLIVQDLYFDNPSGDPSRTAVPTSPGSEAIRMSDGNLNGTNVLIQNCSFNFCQAGIDAQCLYKSAPHLTFVVFGCTFNQCWNQNYENYHFGIDDLFIEQCNFFQNGWQNPTATWPGYQRINERHNQYFGLNEFPPPLVLRTRVWNTTSACPGAWCLQQRPGGSGVDGVAGIQDFVCVGAPYGIQQTQFPSSANRVLYDAAGYIWNTLNGGSGVSCLPNKEAAGTAFQSNCCTNYALSNAIALNCENATSVYYCQTKTTGTQPVNTGTIAGLTNVYQGSSYKLWGSNPAIQTDMTPANIAAGVPAPTITGTVQQFADTYDVSDYAASLKFSTIAQFLAASVGPGQRRGNWNHAFDGAVIFAAIAAANKNAAGQTLASVMGLQ